MFPPWGKNFHYKLELVWLSYLGQVEFHQCVSTDFWSLHANEIQVYENLNKLNQIIHKI